MIAAPQGHEADVEAAAGAASGELAITVVAGGATRAESVGAGLAAVDTELVAVHDAARPLVTAELVETLIGVLGRDPEAAGVIAASPIADTVKRVGEGALRIQGTEDRTELWAAETPQVFRTETLRRAHAATERVEAATDDAMLVESLGEPVLVEPTPGPNLKVTTAADLRVAEALLTG